jgi:hypothetical protein
MSKRYQARDREFRYINEMERRRLRDLIHRGLYRVPNEDVAEAMLPFLVSLR